MRRSIAAIFATFALGVGLVATPSSATAQVTAPLAAPAGSMRGVELDGGVRSYRGIPFAAPPVGELRWRPPQPAARWAGVLDAPRFGTRCTQIPVWSDMRFRSAGSGEDCLTLNVWTPADSRDARLPVLVYFYGGGFFAGDASELRYDGAALAQRGIVVVTANYRLGVFGFLAHPALTAESPRHASGDYGLLDQVAALEWVQRNVAAFGGDPERVTIGGESAGSMSVHALMASPLSRDLIDGAIGESGAMIRPTFPAVPLAEGEAHGLEFARSLGATSLEELRSLSADAVLAAANRPGAGRFPATVDGYFLPAQPTAIYATGAQADVPLLVGWNTEETGWRTLLGDAEPTPANYAAAVRRLYGDDAPAVLAAFPGRTAAEVRASGRALAGARVIAYSGWKWAEQHAATSGQPVYRYLFARPRPAAVTPDGPAPREGAVHSGEIEYALGNLATNPVYAWTAQDYAVSDLTQRYFANFVKTGDPNGAGLPEWPRAYATDPPRVMVLDTVSGAVTAPWREGFELLDRLYGSDRR